MASHAVDHRAAVLALVGTAGSMSRPEIAQRLETSPATVSQLTKELLASGLLEERESAPSRGGRPAQLLALPQPTKRALGVKVGPGHLAIADVGLDGAVHGLAVHEFDPRSADAFGHLTDAVIATVEDRGGADELLGVGIGVPGGVQNPSEGVVNADLLGWRDLPLGRRLRRGLGLPVLVDNDVNALAVGEALYGRGRTQRDVLIVTIGAGIGSAIISDGTVLRGAHGDAGEFGHIPVAEDGPRCVCGKLGCLEALIGNDALVAEAREAGGLAADGGIDELIDAADQGREAVRDTFHRAGETLGRSVATLVNIVDPETVVLYGEGVPAWEHWRSSFEPALRARLPVVRNQIPVEVERSDDRTWVQGAAALVTSLPFNSARAASEQGRLIRARITGAKA